MSGIDLSFVSGKEKFNYRVCAVILSEGKLLAMHDERSPYYYLPGGRVQMGETAEAAVVREVQEELEILEEKLVLIKVQEEQPEIIQEIIIQMFQPHNNKYF